MKKVLILFILLGVVFAQQKIEDKVVARVGDEVITLSEVEELYERYKPLYPNMGEKELKRSILEELISNKLIVYVAKKDTTIARPSDSEVEQALNDRIRILEQQYGAENFANLLQQQGLTRESLKDLFRDNIREEIIVQRYIDKYIRPKIQVTPQEIRSFYDAYKDSLKEPDSYRLAHIFIKVAPDSVQEKAALNKAKNLLNQIKKGSTSFEDAANRYSDDRESASYGGYLGVIPRAFFPPEVQEKLDRLSAGEISEPIKGDYGYHIFKLVNKNESGYELKHILVKVEAKPEEWNKAYQKAVSIKNRIEVQKASFEELAKTFSDDEDTRELGGDLGWIPVSSMPDEYKEKIQGAKVGSILIIKDQNGYHVVKVIDKKEGKTPDFAEVQANIKQYIENQKLQEELSKLIKDLRQKVFVEIKEF
ncbi:MAG: peptidylprolyl isomerase [candidate division WOR-3 bacterium]